MNVTRVILVLITLATAHSAIADDEPLRLAVASNFRQAAEALVSAFIDRYPAEITVSTASTGKLYAQIVNGAPFDVLLAADAERPRLLEESGLAESGTRFTYALGRLVVWSRDGVVAGSNCLHAIRDESGGRLSLANPRTAPYGYAARQALEKLDLWAATEKRRVYGENVSQALQFAASGNASVGFVAAAQLHAENLPATTCRWDVPAEYHDPIRQQAVLLSRAAGHEVARTFMDFLKSDEARRIIERYSYRLEADG